MPIKRCLIGGVIVSGLVLASFLVYVDNFSPYFQQNNNFYYNTRRFQQNSTISRLLISTQQPHVKINSHGKMEISKAATTGTSDQRNGNITEKRTQIFQIFINNNVTTISPKSFKELVVQNRHNDSQPKEVLTTVLNSTLHNETVGNSTIKGQNTSVQESLPPKSDVQQSEVMHNDSQTKEVKTAVSSVVNSTLHNEKVSNTSVERQKNSELESHPSKPHVSTNVTSAPTVLKEPKHFDRPNPNLSGYVEVTNLKTALDIHCSTCAIVSSSGQMLNTKAGPEIDKHECVIRMNDAPVKKFEGDVGKRTTIRVVGHSASGPLKTKQRSLLLGTGQPKHVIMWGPERSLRTDGRGYGLNTMKLMAKLYKDTKFYIHTQVQMDFADKSFEMETGKNRLTSGSWLTTGWFTIQLARNICDDIHMYGMISDDYCKKHKTTTPYHYYEPRGVKECQYYNGMEKQKKNAHRFITEKGVYAKWAKRSPTISFHYPKWEPSG
ncbi:alpha-N-acetyl-neuraminyl-2,3-beta-galactosyl-1,3-N-acetyl-galactosaminide alpha-2,6-sialyltransferase-like isoform X2 [Amphiura filiformis]|uniref:alpha-N-acetyl-neuraminyl-2,3-beta-galactosyl-1, 3-N-acetyl-galactosaminide alpha-2,6-sialyltransferase-like isoform X2 n=1 Tax=Amphiura filiformis TaxID=82378 RepID=UPI003B21F9B5